MPGGGGVRGQKAHVPFPATILETRYRVVFLFSRHGGNMFAF